MPEIPTLEEAEVPGYEVRSWFGMLTPAKTPQTGESFCPVPMHGKGGTRALFQFFLVASEEEDTGRSHANRDYQQKQADRPRDQFDLFTEQISAPTEQ
jgi:hypothetical protein